MRQSKRGAAKVAGFCLLTLALAVGGSNATTLTGMTVEIVVRVTAIEGRKVTFEVSATDDLEPISAGKHARFVVDTAKTVERLKAKAGRWDALKK